MRKFGYQAGWSKSVIKSTAKEYGNFRTKEVRNKLEEKAMLKYGSKDLGSRIANRRNITFELRSFMSFIVGCFVKHCPVDTGNGILNGIKYNVSAKGSAQVQLGGPLAPYIVHLGLPVTRQTMYNGWVYDAMDEAQREFDRLGIPIDIFLSEVGYGFCKIMVTYLGGEEYD